MLRKEINTQRRRPLECLHLVATGLITQECEDVSVMAALDNRDSGSNGSRRTNTVIWNPVKSLSHYCYCKNGRLCLFCRGWSWDFVGPRMIFSISGRANDAKAKDFLFTPEFPGSYIAVIPQNELPASYKTCNDVFVLELQTSKRAEPEVEHGCFPPSHQRRGRAVYCTYELTRGASGFSR